MAHPLVEQVRRAGVVGAGGAGFPTHVKLDAQVGTYICNAAECEPLLCKDQELILAHPADVVRGLRLAMQATGATRGVIAIKKKYHDAIDALQPHLGDGVEIYLFDNFYPAGDEFVVVFDVMGQRIPVGGLPKDVGCAVNNVETLLNIARAADGVPLTHTTLTITGAVQQPCTVTVPIGIRVHEALALAGGPTIEDYAILDGGAMMGKLCAPDDLLTKTSGGFIVLPADHTLIRRRRRPEQANITIAKSTCDQCSYCTDFCPRFLLGYAIEPHKVMRSIGFAGERQAEFAVLGPQCCECNLCSLYACPEDLPVMEMCRVSKAAGRTLSARPALKPAKDTAHPMRDHRRVPTSRLIRRLDLGKYDVYAPTLDLPFAPAQVVLKLGQHIGAPAVPVVKVGDTVGVGQLVAAAPEGKLGAHLHASIAGRVTAIDASTLTIERHA